VVAVYSPKPQNPISFEFLIKYKNQTDNKFSFLRIWHQFDHSNDLSIAS
jgi:hypothetical protein